MQALFVHGMGRSPISGWRLLARLRAENITPHTLGYTATLERFDALCNRLAHKVIRLASHGEYVLIGHSLGGVLIRATLATLPSHTRLPSHVFLLGSPILPSHLAYRLRRNWIFRVLAGDCGQLLASPERMGALSRLHVPTTSIVGTSGWTGRLNPFQGELNDGIVSIAETHADWIGETIRVPAIHTYLPSNRRVADLIVERIARMSRVSNNDPLTACPRDP